MIGETKFSRRFILSTAAAAGGGLLIKSALEPELAAVLAQTRGKDRPLNAWLRVSTDDVVTLISSQSEMGQGAMTTLPAVLAEELGADWSRVKIEFSPAASPYRNPRYNWQFTGNSESTTAFFELLRTMGAAGREMLVAAAANRWGVKPEECHTEKGLVIHKQTGRSLKFGDVADEAAKIPPPSKPSIKPENDWKLLGKSLSRVELPTKVNGTAVFGMDFSLPGMVHATVKQSPVHGGKVASFDKSSMMGMPGVIDVVPVPNGVAVVAETYWQAARALQSLKVTFNDGPNAQLSTESLKAQYRAALDGSVWKTVKSEGQAVSGEAMAGQFAEVFSQEYEAQFLAHATMEPMNCTAHATEDGCTVWGPLQGPQLTQMVLASALKLSPDNITINRTLLGGGFGRRLLADVPLQAAMISRAVGKPVKTVWSREEDMRHDYYRPATLQRITSGLDRDGKPKAIAHKVVSPSILQLVFPPAVTEGNDPSCLEGLMETHYAIPHQRVDFHLLKVGVPTSVLRTTGYGPNIFAVESFIDELAHRSKVDPYQFRRGLLKEERAIKVLDTAIENSGWKKRAPKGVVRGLAIAEAFRTHIAHVVELSVRNNIVKIHRVVSAIDCGVALDPEICKNSIEGGTVWGIGAAFTSQVTFKDGRTVEGNFNSFEIARMYETPPIEVHIVNSSTKELGGTGEVGPVTVVPAIANALFAATGKRYRSLPLSRHGFRLA